MPNCYQLHYENESALNRALSYMKKLDATLEILFFPIDILGIQFDNIFMNIKRKFLHVYITESADMDEKIKVIIADDEENICDMLKSLIQFAELGLELVGCALDGEELCMMIEEKEPQIVITDISMPKVDGLQVIKRCRENAKQCHFIVISGFRQFEYAYNALKYNVSDYLLKPVNENELNELLRKIVAEIYAEEKDISQVQYVDALQNYFLSQQVFSNLVMSNMAFEEINRTYSRHLQEGYFQFFTLRLDDCRKQNEIDEQRTSILGKLKHITEEKLRTECYDVVIMIGFGAVRVLVNFPVDSQKAVEKKYSEIFETAKEVTEIFNELNITMCIGRAVKSFEKTLDSRDEADTADFSRMLLGMKKIIRYSDLPIIQSSHMKMVNDLQEEIFKALYALDKEMFVENMDKLFLLPGKWLCNRNTAMMATQIVMALNKMKKRMEYYKNKKAGASDLLAMLDIYVDISKYHSVLQENVCNEIDMLSQQVSMKNTKPIRQAYDFIEENYGKAIRLEDVAGKIGLSTVYFSNLFSKKTGQTFSDYLTDFRIKKACEMLEKSDMNVSEIAEKVSFNDVRHFSKLFRKKMGIKPTEYRKIYG